MHLRPFLDFLTLQLRICFIFLTISSSSVSLRPPLSTVPSASPLGRPSPKINTNRHEPAKIIHGQFVAIRVNVRTVPAWVSACGFHNLLAHRPVTRGDIQDIDAVRQLVDAEGAVALAVHLDDEHLASHGGIHRHPAYIPPLDSHRRVGGVEVDYGWGILLLGAHLAFVIVI